MDRFSSRRVLPNRKTPRRSGNFGSGLFRSVPVYRAICTPEDEAWALAAFREQREREQAVAAERAADEAETVRRMSEGWRF